MTDIIRIPDMAEVLTVTPRPRDQNPAYIYLMSLAARSGRVSQAQVVRRIAEWLGGTPEVIEWGNLRHAHTTALRTRAIESGLAPASVRKFLSAIRGILHEAWELHQIPTEEYQRAVDLKPVNGESLPAGRYVTEDEVGRIFEACLKETSPIGARDAALLALLYGCGLRKEETILLNLEDYNSAEGRLIVHGKRAKDRIAYITNGTQEALEEWLKLRGAAPGPLFLAITRWGHVRPDKRLSRQMVYNTIIQRAKEAGLESFSPHSLRRTFCSNLLDAGVDIKTVADLVGHRSVTTTALYDRRPDEVRRQGALLLQIPYKAPRHNPEEV